jgi:tripartite-type tricarboxylate transporter receptor subunit TctC
LFKHRYQIDMVHVPYKGGGAAVTDAVSGQIEVLLSGMVTIAPRAQAGQLRALATTGAARAPIMPGVPTMQEAGVNDFVLGPLFGLFAPAGTPPEALERVARDAIAASRTPELKKRYADVGMEVVEPLTGDAFGRHMRSEVQRWREIAAVAGIKED